jgi:hypothetical protein
MGILVLPIFRPARILDSFDNISILIFKKSSIPLTIFKFFEEKKKGAKNDGIEWHYFCFARNKKKLKIIMNNSQIDKSDLHEKWREPLR